MSTCCRINKVVSVIYCIVLNASWYKLWKIVVTSPFIWVNHWVCKQLSVYNVCFYLCMEQFLCNLVRVEKKHQPYLKPKLVVDLEQALFRLRFPKSFKEATISIWFFQYRFTVEDKLDNCDCDYAVQYKYSVGWIYGLVFINNLFFGQYRSFLFWLLNDSTLLNSNISL